MSRVPTARAGALTALALSAVSLAASARAADTDTAAADPPLTRVPNAAVEAVLEAARGRSIVGYAKEAGGRYRLDRRGVGVTLLNFRADCTLAATFPPGSADLARVEAWNRASRGPRAYLEPSGRPGLDWDLDFQGGVRAADIAAALDAFCAAVDAFPNPPAPPPSGAGSEGQADADGCVETSAPTPASIRPDDARLALPVDLAGLVADAGVTARPLDDPDSAPRPVPELLLLATEAKGADPAVATGGGVLVLIQVFGPASGEAVNAWNRTMRFTRAVRISDARGPVRTALVLSVDTAGRTRGSVRQAARVFLDHAARFPQFLRGEPVAVSEDLAVSHPDGCVP